MAIKLAVHVPPTQTVPLDKLEDAPTNANRMSDTRFRSLVERIRELGFLQPILVEPTSNGRFRIVDGHHRVRAARDLGLTEVPAVVEAFDALTSRATALGMNRDRGEIDLAIAAEELVVLAEAGWSMSDMALAGFSEVEAADLLATLEHDDEAVLAGASTVVPQEESDAPASRWTLEIPFDDLSVMTKAKRALKKAGGKDMARGLLRVLGLEE